MTDLSNKKSFAPGARSSSGTLSLPLMLALAACGGRYELGELLPPDPSGSSGAGSTGFEPGGQKAFGHVIIDELGDLDARLSRSMESPVGDIDGDGYDDWVASQPSGLTTNVAPGEYHLPLAHGGPRIAEDLYRADRWGATLIFEATGAPIWPTAAGDLDGDGFGDLLIPSVWHIESSQPTLGTLANWDEQRAYVLYGGPRATSTSQVRLSQAAVTFAPLEPRPTAFGPEQVFAAHPDAHHWRVDRQMRPVSLGDLDADGFDDFAYTHLVTWSGVEVRGTSWDETTVSSDAVTYVFYGGTSRLSADNPSANAAAVLPGVTAIQPIGDLNDDGLPDLVAKKNGQIHLLPGRGARLSGSLTPGLVGAALVPADELEGGWVKTTREVVGVGDLDADGFDDLMVSRWTPLGNAALLFYGGAHRFEQELLDESADAKFLVEEPGSVQLVQRLGDWDGDGHEDLLVVAAYASGEDSRLGWATLRSRAVVIRGGSERYSGVHSADMLAAAPDQQGLAGDLMARPLGDVDGDGRVDLEVQSDTGTFVKYGGPLDSIIY